jgi:hypothetical protein
MFDWLEDINKQKNPTPRRAVLILMVVIISLNIFRLVWQYFFQ